MNPDTLARRPTGTTNLLSPPAGAVTPAVAPREYLAFQIGGEEYAIDILQVQEIRSYEAPTRIAQAPADVAGVLNLRGVIVPIVDLRGHLGTEAVFDAATVTIVLNLRGRTVGAVVDAVCDVVELGGDAVRPPPDLGGGDVAGAIDGIASLTQSGQRRRTLILVNIERLISQVDAGLVDAVEH